MDSIDITSRRHQPKKHYSSLFHYQGSIVLDSDQNEQAELRLDDTRRLLTDLLCTAGSPDEGFRIGALAPAPAGYDFSIAAGVFYLGGMRLDIEAPERFRGQTEYLQMHEGPPVLPNNWLDPALDRAPAAPPAGARTDLVWLEAWEQAVTGAEDEETIETALAVEGSARRRPMRKIHLFPDTPAECDDAFQALVDRLESDGRFSFDPDSAELRSQRRLTVDFLEVAPPADACAPPVRLGYLGAENETIQIRVISDTRFAWSFGNAAPLYRCRLQPADILSFETPPRDAFLRPRVGDMIELVRCDAILANGEFIGERHGLFYRVATDYDPDTGTVGLANGPTAGPFFNETAAANALADALGTPRPAADFLYARVWRGETISADPIGQDMAAAPAWTILGDTGVRVRFSGNGPVGDSWTFSVRPHTPDIIVPWEMRRPCPPSGPRRYITALGLVRWPGAAGVEPEFHDCRTRIRKLERIAGCCEITVGDGQQSRGDTTSIADALARLPASGGKICLLRGVHRENVLIEGRTNVVIEGCGPLARLLGASDDRPVIGIRDSQAITIRNFAIEAPEQVAIAIDDDGDASFGNRTRDIAVDAMDILSRDAPGLVFNGGAGLALTESSLLFAPLERRPAASGAAEGTSSMVILFGRDIRVERCLIAAVEIETRVLRRVSLPLGGIQILGGSADVEIRRNRIRDGSGTGILLGSVTMVGDGEWRPSYRAEAVAAADWRAYRDPASLSAVRVGRWVDVSADGCIRFPPTPPDRPDNPDRPLKPNADPFILGLSIIENEIENMGECGIAPFAQFDLSRDRQFCGVSDLVIRGNRIQGCTHRGAAPLNGGEYLHTGRGGVILGYAEGLDFTDNDVRDCGGGRFDPICGFFAAALSDARIGRNHIHNNGLRVPPGTPDLPLGQRGGIVIRHVQPGLSPIPNPRLKLRLPVSQGGSEALLLHDNQVSCPEGRALQICGVGGMSITGNQLVSLGATAQGQTMVRYNAMAQRLLGSTLQDFVDGDKFPAIFGNLVVSIVNLGKAGDFDQVPFGSGPVAHVDPSGDVAADTAITTGRLLFADNQTRYGGLAPVSGFALALVGLASNDDARMISNQCDSDAGTEEPVMTHGLVIGASANMSGNRFSEPKPEALALSGVCYGRSSFMHHNFGTHCFLGQGSADWSVLEPTNYNRHLMGADRCQSAKDGWNRRVRELLFRPGIRYPVAAIETRARMLAQGGLNG